MIMCSEDDVLWPLFERASAMRPDAERRVVGGADFQPDNDPQGVADGLRAFYSKSDVSARYWLKAIHEDHVVGVWR